jgi:hypothetical protein
MRCSESDTVVLRSVPNSVIQDRERFPETYELISSGVGNSFHVRRTNDLGMIEIWIAQDGTDTSDACADSVWIEPEFLASPETESPNTGRQATASPSPAT